MGLSLRHAPGQPLAHSSLVHPPVGHGLNDGRRFILIGIELGHFAPAPMTRCRQAAAVHRQSVKAYR
jgi:hypothetical protein